MIDREDFYKINEITLRKYYKEVYGKEVCIKTKKYSLINSIFIYPHIGTIMTRLPDIKALRYLLNEYNIRNKPIKNILSKTYVISCFLTVGLLSSKGLCVSDKYIFDNHTVVIPANRKIRVYNFKTGYVDAIVKDTFTKRYFNNEVSFRVNCTYEFVPPIIAYGEDWYREKILPGQPLARLRDEKLYNKCIKDTIGYMGIIAKKTTKYVSALDYSKSLYDEILRKIVIAKANKNIDCYDMIIEIAAEAYKKGVLLENPIPTVESHGDLQSGNVWVDINSQRTYIIDWETHGRRSVWYDCATILLSIRRANKLKYMMDNCKTEAVKNAILVNDSRKDYNMQSVIGIITLEDLLFYIEDMLELPKDFGGEIFNRIAREFDKMGWRSIYAK
ncbi:phosphotransferase [Proteiniclasticum ruminis]|nr:phosphotransferase [Proteiniclasticum ruminis]